MVDREVLHDHAADRQSHDVGSRNPSRVEDGDRVERHVGQPIRRTLIVRDSVGEVGRLSDVAVVETDHVEPGGDEQFAPVVVVVDAL